MRVLFAYHRVPSGYTLYNDLYCSSNYDIIAVLLQTRLYNEISGAYMQTVQQYLGGVLES